MNSLSFLIYFASTAPKIASFLGNVGIFFGLAVPVLLFGGLCTYFDMHDKKMGTTFFKYSIACLCIAIFLNFVKVFIPSEKTIYMIAASEAAEEVINNPTAKRLASTSVEYIEQTLKAKLDELTQEQLLSQPNQKETNNKHD